MGKLEASDTRPTEADSSRNKERNKYGHYYTRKMWRDFVPENNRVYKRPMPGCACILSCNISQVRPLAVIVR